MKSIKSYRRLKIDAACIQAKAFSIIKDAIVKVRIIYNKRNHRIVECDSSESSFKYNAMKISHQNKSDKAFVVVLQISL